MFVYLPLLNKIMTPMPTPPTPSTTASAGLRIAASDLDLMWGLSQRWSRMCGWMNAHWGPILRYTLSYHTTQLQSIIHISRWYWMRIRRIISSIWMRWLAVDGIDFPRLMMFINELRRSSYAPITSSSAKYSIKIPNLSVRGSVRLSVWHSRTKLSVLM